MEIFEAAVYKIQAVCYPILIQDSMVDSRQYRCTINLFNLFNVGNELMVRQEL